jgi:hypothetical protein
MTYTGTNHFNTIREALRYFSDYGMSNDDINRKINDHEIRIGKPEEIPGTDLRLNSEGRWERTTKQKDLP